MSKIIRIKLAFRTIVLFTIASTLYYGISVKWRWSWPETVITQKPLCPKHRLHMRNDVTYGDLSEEFEAQMEVFRLSTDVFEALKRDGYNPMALSMNILTLQIQKQVENASVESLNSTFAGASMNSTNVEPEASRKEPSSLALLVPNVVHYVLFGTDLTFTFTNYLSYLSVERFIQPEQIFVHGDNIPEGHWWNLTINTVRNIYHVKRTYSKTAPNGNAFRYKAHISDYLRTEIMLRYGGIYLDADVLVVKSFTPLRQHSVTLGRESDIGVCNGIIIAEKGAPFLRLLLEQYRSYTGPKEIWAEKSVINTNLLAKLYPHLVHVEETTLNRPNYKQRALLFDGWYNWTQNYAVHLWIRLWPMQKRPNGFEDILTKNTTFAEIARLIMFGFPNSKAIVTG